MCVRCGQQPVILFTETGLIPIRYRRLEFSLRFLVYATQCPRGHYVREAMEEAVKLDFGGDKSWISDLRTTIQRLPFHCAFPTHDLLGDPDVVGHLIKIVRDGARVDLQRRVEASPKLYLLHGRMEKDEDGGLTRTVPVFLRHYLKVANPAHRVALSQVLLSGHKYAVETGRRGKSYRARVDRTCRLCNQVVETPEHVWLECDVAGQLVQLRRDMVGDVGALCTPNELDWMTEADGDIVETMKRLVALRSAVSRVAQYAFDVSRFMAREVQW
ncbi:hypothetical protein FA13DRAFT_1877563 [Coprinellus micaceus]|uniref:Reverse transcriptase zinc-binding domain-containing protein n=1 Tax=Coprinellus micaceus TaxID=71717 RepID=A0A4Y7T1I3_COPMI|nr:hypothetical protein FA13DRAFT_1877563 [Coprinellus micaceus]